MTPERRRFLARTGIAMSTAAATAVFDAPRTIAQPHVQWRLSTTWPPTLEVLQGSAQRLARIVAETTGGRFKIDVFPGGQIVTDFGCFEATSAGTIEAFMGTPGYWADREPAFEWFQTLPFGMNPQGMAAWYHDGGGRALWEEAYATFNLVPRQGPAFAPQMGGWFRKRITAVSDLKGLRLRIGAGLGNRVLTRAGVTTVLIPAAGIFSALERGVVDAAEWVGPHDDMKLGLHKTARYYYYPGWHEPGTVSEFAFNRKAYEALPVDLRRTLDHAVAAVQRAGLADFHAKNAAALGRLRADFTGTIELVRFPDPVLRDLKRLAADVVREQSEKTALARKVHASFAKFQSLIGAWDHVAEGAYHQLVAG